MKILNNLNIYKDKVTNKYKNKTFTLRNYLQLITIFLIILNSFSQNQQLEGSTISPIKPIEQTPSFEYDGILGIGWGVFAIIISIFVGVCCCFYGFSTIYPLVFYIIGFIIPIIVFFLMSFAPLEKEEQINTKENSTKNNLLVFKWFLFSFLSFSLFLLLIPFMRLWNTVLIPQRVDSKTKKDLYEKINLNKNDEDDKNNQNKNEENKNDIFNEPEILPLNNIYVSPEQQQDIELGKIENLANKEKKRKLGGLKRKKNEDEENQ
jgi:hypothetical protein